MAFFTDILREQRLNKNGDLVLQYVPFVDKIQAKNRTSLKIAKIWSILKDPSIENFLVLPKKCVIKPNHCSGRYMILNGDQIVNDHKRVSEKFSKSRIVDRCREWLSKKHSKTELWYHHIKPTVFIEELLDVQRELRFHCFHGEIIFIEHVQSINGRNPPCQWFLPNWQVLDVKCHDPVDLDNLPKKPPRLHQYLTMVHHDVQKYMFDYVRYDTYIVGNDEQLYFSEWTFAPNALHTKFEPEEFEHLLGKILLGEKLSLDQFKFKFKK